MVSSGGDHSQAIDNFLNDAMELEPLKVCEILSMLEIVDRFKRVATSCGNIVAMYTSTANT